MKTTSKATSTPSPRTTSPVSRAVTEHPDRTGASPHQRVGGPNKYSSLRHRMRPPGGDGGA
ncbi:MAG: hypothetical protein R2856_39325 [Caldilineaceae bacterium]